MSMYSVLEGLTKRQLETSHEYTESRVVDKNEILDEESELENDMYN